MKPAPWALAIAAAGAAALSAAQQPATPTFRAAVDLIAVDVQVVTRDGDPVGGLAPAAFSVTIDGRDRRVVSVDHIQHAPGDRRQGTLPQVTTGASARNDWPASGQAARTFLLAFDTGSFSVADSRKAAQAARAFIDRLLPDDTAGVYSFPFGPRLTPTADRAAVRAALDAVTGGARALSSQFHLTPAEVIDINAEFASMPLQPGFGMVPSRGQPTIGSIQADTLRRVMLRECGSDSDFQCAQNIERDAATLAQYYEAEVTRDVNELAAFIRGLGTLPGRKTVVLFSAGMPVTDRPGGRPSTDDLARVLGQDAARANASIYALHFDTALLQSYAAETRRISRNSVSQERDSAVMSHFLAQFANSAGGTLMRVMMGAGEGALGQILRETSAYYLLGVAPSDTDRDGRVHRLKVRVDSRGSTIRSRTWVQIPQRLRSR